MNLDRICIEPRLRESWEAIDLGFCLARTWYRQLLLTWLLPMLIVAIVGAMLLRDNLHFALIGIWWFKPVFDRAPLFFISRALFGEVNSARTVLKQFIHYNKFEWLPWLTWRRLSFTRSYDMPVTLLEHLSGQPRRNRLQVLHHKGSGAALALTFMCIVLEMCLAYGSLILLASLIPEEANLDILNGVFSESQLSSWLEFILYLMALALVAPFYVCAGFALYINRRIELEAWDVEIRFRQILSNTNPLPKNKLALQWLLPLCLAPLLYLVEPNSSSAEAVSVNPQAAMDSSKATAPPVKIETLSDAKQLIAEIKNGEDFHQEKTVTRWRRKNSSPNEVDEHSSLEKWLEKLFEKWLKKHDEEGSQNQDFFLNFKGIALFLEIIIWLTFGALLFWVLYRYRRQLANLITKSGIKQKPVAHTAPEVMFGLKVTTDSLPEDVISEVNKLCQKAEYRLAISLLYRASLSQLIHRKGFRFRDSLTEVECAEIVKRGEDIHVSKYTDDLTRVWQRLAYGHINPQAAQIEQLCSGYSEVFAS